MSKTSSLEILEEIALLTEVGGEEMALCGGLAAFALSYHNSAAVQPVYTEDADLIVETRIYKQRRLRADNQTLSEKLNILGYKLVVKALPIENAAGEMKWVKENESFYLEFLTEDKNGKSHSVSGITAIGLSYFSMSLDNTIIVTLPSGRILRVVAPEAFILHKLLTYKKRKEQAKQFKDLYYICYAVFHFFKPISLLNEKLQTIDVHQNWKIDALKNIKRIQSEIPTLSKKIMQADSEGWLNEKIVIESFKKLEKAMSEPRG